MHKINKTSLIVWSLTGAIVGYQFSYNSIQSKNPNSNITNETISFSSIAPQSSAADLHRTPSSNSNTQNKILYRYQELGTGQYADEEQQIPNCFVTANDKDDKAFRKGIRESDLQLLANSSDEKLQEENLSLMEEIFGDLPFLNNDEHQTNTQNASNSKYLLPLETATCKDLNTLRIRLNKQLDKIRNEKQRALDKQKKEAIPFSMLCRTEDNSMLHAFKFTKEGQIDWNVMSPVEQDDGSQKMVSWKVNPFEEDLITVKSDARSACPLMLQNEESHLKICLPESVPSSSKKFKALMISMVASNYESKQPLDLKCELVGTNNSSPSKALNIYKNGPIKEALNLLNKQRAALKKGEPIDTEDQITQFMKNSEEGTDSTENDNSSGIQ